MSRLASVRDAHADHQGCGNSVRQEDEQDEIYVIVICMERPVGVHVGETHLGEVDTADDRAVLHKLEEMHKVD